MHSISSDGDGQIIATDGGGGSTLTDGCLDCLERIGVSADLLLDNCYLRMDDVVIVAGTLVEGIGNAFSDVDVYVLTDRLRTVSEIELSKHHRVITTGRDLATEELSNESVFLIHTASPASLVKIDIEFKAKDDVAELFKRIETIYNYASQRLILLTKTLSDREQVFVHRMLNCHVLHNQEGFDEIRKLVCPRKYAYIAYRWVASDFSKLLDILGAWQQGDLDRAADLVRESVILQLSGYLRLRGLTNLRRKWLLTYLRDCREPDWLHSRAKDLLFYRELGNGQDKRDYVRASLDFIDDIYDLSRPLLEAMPEAPSGASALQMLVEEARLFGSDSRYSEWEFAYRARAYAPDERPTRALLDWVDADC